MTIGREILTIDILNSSGYLGPAGYHLDNKYPAECIGGAAGYIDRKILTLDHMYQYPTAREVYNTGPFDPEGIFGRYTQTEYR